VPGRRSSCVRGGPVGKLRQIMRHHSLQPRGAEGHLDCPAAVKCRDGAACLRHVSKLRCPLHVKVRFDCLCRSANLWISARLHTEEPSEKSPKHLPLLDPPRCLLRPPALGNVVLHLYGPLDPNVRPYMVPSTSWPADNKFPRRPLHYRRFPTRGRSSNNSLSLLYRRHTQRGPGHRWMGARGPVRCRGCRGGSPPRRGLMIF